MTLTWTNWSGGVICTPQAMRTPQTEAEIVALVKQASDAGQTIRVAGTGHSFVPLCATDGVLLSLDGLQGIVRPHPPAGSPETEKQVSGEGELATIWAGTKIHEMGYPLWELGLAMANMGDIDRQAIAGAISTGTHGTGHTLGSISTQVVGLRLVTATGELIDCSPSVEPEIFKAAQVALGALGIITQVTLRLLPAYQLHERTWVAPFDECVAHLAEQIQANRHFEFFWVPSEDVCAMKTLNLPHPPAGSPETKKHVSGEGGQVMTPPLLTDILSSQERGAGGEVTGRLTRYIREERIDRSYRIFPSERNLKFNEMEFAVPAVNGLDCLYEVRELMQRKHPDVLWPIEYRTLAADDIPLSPAYGRATVTISIHQAAELPYQAFFADAEAIFRNHQGRPHWGKIHTHRAGDLDKLYPQWDQFQRIRQQMDPNSVWLNGYLKAIFV